MSLPTQAIDRMFSRLQGTYGSAWERSHGATPLSDVKAVWGHELSGFGDKLKMIAWALENLPERCPNVIEFRNLARRAPTDEPLQIAVKADPEQVAKELLRLGQLRSQIAKPVVGAKDWAHRILSRFDAGEKIPPINVRFAREALDLSASSQVSHEQ